jgi:hypothetical protein
MTTQQPEALDLADWLEAVGGGLSAKRCAALLREQHARITELEAQLAQRFDAADMATAAAQGFRDGVASLTAQAAESAIENCPELNMGNYDAVGVERLNDWAIRAHDEIDRLHALAAGQVTAQPVAEPTHAQIAAYLEATGAYVTNDASREAAIADAVEADRAAHGQAPTGTTEPTEQQILEAAEKAGLWPNTVHSWIPAFHRYHKELAKAQPAQAQADSVQEDAARYRWLREGNDANHGAAWHVAVNLYGCEWDAAIDAARKQGASHDNS